MTTQVSEPVDCSRWIDLPPEHSPRSTCLPGYGGRVIVRGYDPDRWDLLRITGSQRWQLDVCLIPATDTAAKRTAGPGGSVFPGDCVIFVDAWDDEPDAQGWWFPQRVLHVEPGHRGWQRVLCLRDMDVDREGVDDPEREWPLNLDLARLMNTPALLLGDLRRAALEVFRLNVDCPVCGARGVPIMWGMPPGPPGPHVATGGCLVDPRNPNYECRCGASWRIDMDGILVLTSPGRTGPEY